MTSRPLRRRVEPTADWEQIALLCGWPEQREYELIRPLVLFGGPADGRAEETGASSGRTLRRKAVLFEAEGMENLFGSETAKRRRLPPAVRRLIVDLKAEHPGFNPNEISRVCYVRFGRLPARKTVKRVLTEEPVPLRFVRRFPPYHESPERRDARAAVVALHADGLGAKAISGYLRVGTSLCRHWNTVPFILQQTTARRRAGSSPALHVGSSSHVTSAAYSWERGRRITQLQYLVHLS
jgi:hypothetical protein